jgi:hypothetical protein
VLAPQRIAAGAVLRAGPEAPIAVGNTLPLAAMPAGTQVTPLEHGLMPTATCSLAFGAASSESDVQHRCSWLPGSPSRVVLCTACAMPALSGLTAEYGEGRHCCKIGDAEDMPAELQPTDCLQVHNIELRPGKGGQMVRAAGTSATLISKGAPLPAAFHAQQLQPPCSTALHSIITKFLILRPLAGRKLENIARASAEVTVSGLLPNRRRWLCAGAAAVGGAAGGAEPVHGDHRCGVQPAAREPQDRQGGLLPAHGLAARGAGSGHELGGPSARRRPVSPPKPLPATCRMLPTPKLLLRWFS